MPGLPFPVLGIVGVLRYAIHTAIRGLRRIGKAHDHYAGTIVGQIQCTQVHGCTMTFNKHHTQLSTIYVTQSQEAR